jgi:hypothetical protein
VDGVRGYQAIAPERNLHFPFLADFHPKVADREQEGV